jgi:hypothetical protein
VIGKSNIHFPDMLDLGTKPIKNKDSKKNGLVIDLSAKDICFNCSMNFEIMMAV